LVHSSGLIAVELRSLILRGSNHVTGVFLMNDENVDAAEIEVGIS